MSEYSTISAVARAFQVVEALADAPGGAAVTTIAERVGIEFSIASRILTTLAGEGYVRRDPTSGYYHLTHKLAAAVSRLVEGTGFPDFCMPLLQDVADSTGELVQLAVLEGTELTFVAKAEGKHRIRMLSALGRDAPFHASSVGKAYLASLPEQEALRLVAARGMPAFTPHTITTISKLLAELRKVRNLGFAVVEEEYIEGGIAIGAVVRVERMGGVVGAVSIAGPSFRVKGAQIKELGKQMISLAERVGSIWPAHRTPAAKSA